MNILISLFILLIISCSPNGQQYKHSLEAVESYNKAKKIHEKDPDTAIKLLELAIEKDRIFPQAYMLLAKIYEKKGNEQKAEEYLTKAIDTTPTDKISIYYNERARFYHRNKKYVSAQQDYMKAIDTSLYDKNRPWYYLNYAALLADTGRYNEALKTYSIVLDMDIEPDFRRHIAQMIADIQTKIANSD